jgi:hypothetical protein
VGDGGNGGDAPFFDDVVEDFHHGHGLLFGEAFFLEALHKAERVEVVIAFAGRGGVEGAAEDWVADDAAQASASGGLWAAGIRPRDIASS